MKTGLPPTGGGFGVEEVKGPPPEYFDPEASATFCKIRSGLMSLSDRAVI